MLPAVEHAEFHDAGDFLSKTHTTRAVDAAAHFLGRHQRAEILMEHDPLFLGIARGATAVTHG